MNQFSQNGLVAARFVRQTHGLAMSDGTASLRRSDGTEARAEVLLRIVRDRRLLMLAACIYYADTVSDVLPLDSCGHGWKARWPRGEIPLHALQSVHCGACDFVSIICRSPSYTEMNMLAFNHIQHCVCK